MRHGLALKNGSFTLVFSAFVWVREDVPKEMEHKVPSLSIKDCNQNKRETEMNELETVGEVMERTGGCFGLMHKDIHACQSCSDEGDCKRCAEMVATIKKMPRGAQGMFVDTSLPHKTVDSFRGQTNDRVVAAIREADNACVKVNRQGVDREHSLDDADAIALVAFDRIQELLNDKAPDVMKCAEGNVARAVRLVLNALVSSVATFKAMKTDLDGMEDRLHGWEGRHRRELDGTFVPRAGNPSLVRKRGGVVVGCDDQSGEDVCADANG